MNTQPSSQLRVIDPLIPHRHVERQLRRKPKWHRHHALPTLCARRHRNLLTPRQANRKIGPERIDNDAVTKFFDETLQKVADGHYDPMTANLMEWYINEEKDSVKRLRPAYARIRGSKAKANGQAEAAMGGPSADAEAIMACMTAGFKSLEKSLEKLAKAVR